MITSPHNEKLKLVRKNVAAAAAIVCERISSPAMPEAESNA